jgi:hypothetical protein
VVLPDIPPFPDSMRNLYSGRTSLSRRFLNNIRVFNNAFAFTSLGTDNHGQSTHAQKVIPGRGPKPFQAKSNLYHRLGSLTPAYGHTPCFAQIYFHHANQDPTVSINQRLDFIYSGHQPNKDNKDVTAKTRMPSAKDRDNDKKIVQILEQFFTSSNHYARLYKTAAQRINDSNGEIVTMTLISQQKANPRLYNNPTTDEVAAILPGDGTHIYQDRDILVQALRGGFKRISALSSCYWPLGYPLIFPRGENGFHLGLTRKSQPLEALAVQYAELPALYKSNELQNNTDTNFVSTQETDFESDSSMQESDSDNDSNQESEYSSFDDSEEEGSNDEEQDYKVDQSGVKTHGNDTDDDDDSDDYDHNHHNQKEHRITMKDDFSYRLQVRHNDNSEFILRSKHLLQQWVVDMFCTMDMNNLNFFAKNQEKIRASLYSGMCT